MMAVDPKTLWALALLGLALLQLCEHSEHFLPHLLFAKVYPDRSLSAHMCQVLDPKKLRKSHC